MRRWLTLLIPVLVIGSLVTWRLEQKKADTEAQTQQRAARMKGPAIASLAPAQIRDIVRTFEATGSVEAPLSVKIAPKVTGRIDYLEVREGDRVQRGQVLVRIDDSEVEGEVQRQMAAVAEAKYRLAQARLNLPSTDVAVAATVRQQAAALKSAQADYNQVLESSKAEVEAAKANVQDAASKVENAEASVKSAEANLRHAEARHERVVSLHEKGFTSAQAVDDAVAALAVQRAAVDVAQGLVRSAKAVETAARQRLTVAESKGKADVEAAMARLEQTSASLESAQANTAQKSAYRQSIAALEASVNAAEAALTSARARRRDTVLISPLDGFVTGRFSDPGAIASPTQPVLAVQFVKLLWVSVSVPEEVCSKLHIGQEVKVRFDALAGRVLEASIVQINPSADPQSRQFTVRAVMSNGGGLLKPGMFGHVTMETERVSGVLTVPREAIQRDKTGTVVVLVNKQHKATRVPVELGAEGEEYVAVTHGLRPSDMVVTMSSLPIKDGQMVTPGGPKGGTGSGSPAARGGKPDGKPKGAGRG